MDNENYWDVTSYEVLPSGAYKIICNPPHRWNVVGYAPKYSTTESDYACTAEERNPQSLGDAMWMMNNHYMRKGWGQLSWDLSRVVETKKETEVSKHRIVITGVNQNSGHWDVFYTHHLPDASSFSTFQCYELETIN